MTGSLGNVNTADEEMTRRERAAQEIARLLGELTALLAAGPLGGDNVAGIDREHPMSLRLLAERSGLSYRSLRDAAVEGRLRAYRCGGRARGELTSTVAALDEFLRANPAATPTSESRLKTTEPVDPYIAEVADFKARVARKARRAG